jgi:hypothetical protein
MLVLLKFIATFAAAMFAGAALYVNVAEHPARMTLDTKFAAAQWAPSYRRATGMQAPLALLSLVAGLGSWLLGGDLGWAVAALLIGAVPSHLSVSCRRTGHYLRRVAISVLQRRVFCSSIGRSFTRSERCLALPRQSCTYISRLDPNHLGWSGP